jgi:peptidoglycan L-alanyl-D-glutamate endopeptidase CwlK
MVNSREIKDLHTCLQRGANELIDRMDKNGYKVCITSTLRDYDKQNALYAQGRDSNGKIVNRLKVVTNAKGGESNHNFGVAFDICQNVKGAEYSNDLFFATAGAIWEDMGGTWGGHFKTIKDRPHFEYTGGLYTKAMDSGKRLPIDAKMKWEK